MNSLTPSTKLRLLRVLWPLIVVVAIQAVLAAFSLCILSSVRAYVGGEGLWTKGQKDAVYFLDLYATTGEEQYYQQYRSAIAVPLADRTARLALEQHPPDLEAARAGFLGGRIHPDDVDGLIWLFRDFAWFGPLQKAIQCWTATDDLLEQLAGLGHKIHADISPAPGDPDRFRDYRRQIYDLNSRLTPQAVAFSNSLGAGSRFITNLLTAVNFVIAVILILLAAWHMRRLLLQRLDSEKALTLEKERAVTTLASLGEAVISTDARGWIDYANPAAEALTRCTFAEARDKHINTVLNLLDSGTNDPSQLIDTTLSGEASQSRYVQLSARRDKKPIAVSVVGSPIRVAESVVGAVFVLHDRTDEEKFIARLSWQATHDELTRLPNRREFERRLAEFLKSLESRPDCHTLMFIDLDQFKIVNDTCGHIAGDKLLQEVAATLWCQLRKNDLLARLGGDEFAVILESCSSDSAAGTAERLRQSVEKLNFIWNGRSFRVTASIGVTHFDDAALTMKQALRTADIACYTAKENGRNRVVIHDPSDTDLQARVSAAILEVA
jgi:diguanylate cyclase (GGDEF)-like protein/PAS domain S-box-containing protein